MCIIILKAVYIGVLWEALHNICQFPSICDNFAKLGTSTVIKNVDCDYFMLVRRWYSYKWATYD